MLNTQELANFISSGLNAISSQKGFSYVFDINAEVYNDSNDGHIKGVLMRVANNPLVVKDFVSAKMTYRIELAVPARANKNIINIESIIGDFVATYEDTEQEFSSGNGSFEFEYSRPENFKVSCGVGDNVPLTFSMVVNFTDSGLLGSSKVWLLDGEEIPYLTEAVLLDKEGTTNRISEEFYNKTILLAQSKFYKFTVVFDKENTVSTTLQADILAGDFKKTYTLTYYDGVNYTEEDPFETTVSIFRTADTKSDGGSLSTFEVTFADVSQNEIAPKYTIELFSVPFDRDNERYFDGVDEQTEWFNNQPHPHAVQIKAPTLNTVIETTQVYDYDGDSFSQIDLANMNMARINEKKDTATETEYEMTIESRQSAEGTITGSRTGENISFTIENETQVVLDGITYTLRLVNGEYHLYDGGGTEITINQYGVFHIDKNYYLVEDNLTYKIVDADQNVYVSLSKQIAVQESGISLGNYNNLTITGEYDANNELQFYLSGENVNIALNKRNITRSNVMILSNYFWVEPQENGYKVIWQVKPYYSINDYDVAQLGDAFATINDVTYTLVSPNLITGSDGSTIILSEPTALYYEFDLDGQYYFDNTDNSPQTGTPTDYWGFYGSTYSLETEFRGTVSTNFELYGQTYTLQVTSSSIKILIAGMMIYADITQTRQFEIDCPYTIATSGTIITSGGTIKQNNEIVATITTSQNADYDYQFTLGGLLYYITQDNDVYNIYTSTGQEFRLNIENGGTFVMVSGYNYYYYFIQNAEIGADKQIILTLEMDTFQTFCIGDKLQFSDCNIERAMLNRFIDNGDNTVSFNGRVDSPLFEREEAHNVSKRLVSRKKLLQNIENDSDIEDWFQQNVEGWVYAYLPKETLALPPIYAQTPQTAPLGVDFNTLKHPFYESNGKLDGQFMVFCCPVYKTDKRIMFKFKQARGLQYSANVAFDLSAFMDWLQLSQADGLPYAIKFSNKFPCELAVPLSNDLNIDANGNIVSDLIVQDAGGKVTTANFDIIRVGVMGESFIKSETTTVSGETAWCGALYVPFYKMNYDMENYNLINPVKFPKSNSNYIDTVFYEIKKAELSASSNQMFILPRTSINVPIIRVEISYTNTSNVQTIGSWSIDNIVQTASFEGGLYSLNIKEGSMEFRINSLPADFKNFNYIRFKNRVYGLVGADKNPMYNPKLLNSDYRSLTFTDNRGNQFEYDIQKLNKAVIQTEVCEPLVADLQRYYFRVKNSDGVYQEQCSQNLTGLVATTDSNIPLSASAMKQMLAEQPNYYNQRNLGWITGAVKNIGGGIIGGAVGGNVLGMNMSTGSAGALGGFAGAIGSLMGIVNTLFTEDNMKQRADSIQNANGNVIFNAGYSKTGYFIEQYALLPHEEKIINDFMFKNGYSYNRVGNIRNFMHTRKYFDIIKAQIETMKGAFMSNAIKENLRQRFESGIRLWHTDDIQYELENYELWLEE